MRSWAHCTCILAVVSAVALFFASDADAASKRHRKGKLKATVSRTARDSARTQISLDPKVEASKAGEPSMAVPRTEYVVRAELSNDLTEVGGEVLVSFRNTSDRTLNEVVFVLFPNRFSEPDHGVNDFNRPYLYPEEEFHAGGLRIYGATDSAGSVLKMHPLPRPGLPTGTAARLLVPPLAPGDTIVVQLRFLTTVPRRFGSFGSIDGRLTASGGWFPTVAALSQDGTWLLDEPPPAAEITVNLEKRADVDILLGGELSESGASAAALSGGPRRTVSLAASPELIVDEFDAGATRVRVARIDEPWRFRISFENTPEDFLQASVRDMLRDLPPGLTAPRTLTIVEAPLRLSLTAPSDDVVLVSDRFFRVAQPLRAFHEQQLAYAVFSLLLEQQRGADLEPWMREGLAHHLAKRFIDQKYPVRYSTQDWIEAFNIFAVVDRFETAPQIPFVEAFFERSPAIDPLRLEFFSYSTERPPGWLVLSKFRELAGNAPFDEIASSWLVNGGTFAEALSIALPSESTATRTTEWLQGHPQIDYSVAAADLNIAEGDRFRHHVTLGRNSSRRFQEPVTLRLRSIGGHPTDFRWNSAGDLARMSVTTGNRILQASIDPDRKVIDRDRTNNAWPPTPQIVLDSAEVEVSSTEFGVSTLIVGRARYDYRKDLAVATFYTNRSLGLTAGARYHWGKPIDPARFRHNVYAFYSFQNLDGGFDDDSRPTFHTSGQLGGLGFRYDYTNAFAYDNPGATVGVRLYGDWFDKNLGGNFNYVDGGARFTASHPLWSPRVIAAVQALAGLSEPLGTSVVPNQGRYSLGGWQSIRGIGAEDELGENIALLRGELRHNLYPEFDHSLMDLLVARRLQLRAFVDAGRVDDKIGRAFDVGNFAVGVGLGVGLYYDFLGFFPSLAYIQVATRVDDSSKSDDIQFLFGSRQAF